ncbi:hypothetical protein [Clostridium thailandense]|uniref:hypothetical protein n=1 Tax=Clostridium thailandense TaxID=2794346 RepID=UPI0039896D99
MINYENGNERKKRIKDIELELKKLFNDISITIDISKSSLDAKIGSKIDHFIYPYYEPISSSEQFKHLWMEGLKEKVQLDTDNNRFPSANFELHKLINDNNLVNDNKLVKEYTKLFLERSYLKHYEYWNKKKITDKDNRLWIGYNKNNYGILISPRFKNGNWDNDVSEIKKFKKDYFTIGHILKTGLVRAFKNEKVIFKNVTEYLEFFLEFVKKSNSPYEDSIANKYCTYVMSNMHSESIPLLIPQLRYKGLEEYHEYRLDFCIINPKSLRKVGFEISPFSTHFNNNLNSLI